MHEVKGQCHCGTVQFEVTFRDGINAVHRCDCSICRRKGAIMAAVPLADLRVTHGEDSLTLYTWNTHTAKHYFCRICGVYTHHQKRSDPTKYGINVGCLSDVDPYAFSDVPVYNGINHPCDQ